MKISKSIIAANGSATVDHRVFENLWHVFHLQVSVLPEAREAIADLGAKLRNHVTTDKRKAAVK